MWYPDFRKTSEFSSKNKVMSEIPEVTKLKLNQMLILDIIRRDGLGKAEKGGSDKNCPKMSGCV